MATVAAHPVTPLPRLHTTPTLSTVQHESEKARRVLQLLDQFAPTKQEYGHSKFVAHTTPAFDPEKHLAFKEPSQSLMMKDLGFDEDVGISPVAVTHPFQLFTHEAVQIMRSEISNPAVRETCKFQSNLAANQLRGYARDYAPFTYEAWNHPRTIEIVSKLAGVELVPWGDYEIGHINLSAKTDEKAEEELRIINEYKNLSERDKAAMGCPWEKDKPIVGWHLDSYPFVCVLMLSDCNNMVGGETALRTANGQVIKVRGPTEGCAVILQGRYIMHQAMRALGSKERITSVTSYRPASPFIKDDTVMRTVRPVSNLSELYYDFAEYRLDIMEQRIRKARERMAADRVSSRKFDTLGYKTFLKQSIDFLTHTNDEIVEETKISKGYIQEVPFPDAKIEV